MSFIPETYDPALTAEWLICKACGTQFPTADRATRKRCHICDDPRQFIPAEGQQFTTMRELRDAGHRNEFTPYKPDARLTFINTMPRVAIGQRAILIKTPEGNVLWDCITLLDDETIARIEKEGGLKAIVISHPHFYSTHVEWAKAFGCPVFIAAEDAVWTAVESPQRVLLTETETAIAGTSARAIKLGGHFPGSLVLLFDGRLFTADTLMITPVGLQQWDVDADGSAKEQPPGHNYFSFNYSYPNLIPLGPDELARMWAILQSYAFGAAHGGFPGMNVENGRVKELVLESMKIQTRAMGHPVHPILSVTM